MHMRQRLMMGAYRPLAVNRAPDDDGGGSDPAPAVTVIVEPPTLEEPPEPEDTTLAVTAIRDAARAEIRAELAEEIAIAAREANERNEALWTSIQETLAQQSSDMASIREQLLERPLLPELPTEPVSTLELTPEEIAAAALLTPEPLTPELETPAEETVSSEMQTVVIVSSLTEAPAASAEEVEALAQANPEPLARRRVLLF